MISPEHDNQWWTVEPPEYDLEPGDAVSVEDEYLARKMPYTTEQLAKLEYLNGTQSHPLFENVRVIEEDGELSFSVPKRFIDTPSHGKWELEAYGRRRWFKEHDDYGEIRFLANGTALWIPHLYPFEETTEQGVPLIPDRERCALTVTLKSMQTFEPNDSPNVMIETPRGSLSADINLNIEISYGGDRNYFELFEMLGKPLVSQLVTYDDRWHSLAAYLEDPATPEAIEQYHLMMLDRVPMPETYLRSKEPNDWTERTPSGHSGEAFGEVWVPVDELRRGINADISFPLFKG
jgi:hypothetical protein